jgi:tetratricopeptide (TPR) repeat protein
VREAHALRLLSWEGRLGADYATSRVYLREAAARFKEAGLPGEAAGCLFMLVRRLGGTAKHVIELDDAEQAFALCEECGDYRLQAMARKNLAVAFTYQDRYAEALPLAEEALEMLRDLGDRHECCSVLDVLGVILARSGRREEAAATFERCLLLAEEIDFAWGIVSAVFGLYNYWYIANGEPGRWLDFLDERLDYAVGQEHDWLVGFLTWLRTKGLCDVGEIEEAHALSQTAAFWVTEEDLLSAVFVQQYAGVIWAELGEYEQARSHLVKSLGFAEKTCDRYLLSWPLVSMANLALIEGAPDRFGEGLEQAEVALEAAREVREEKQWAEALDAGARLHLASGHIEAAYDVSVQAMQLLEVNPWLPKPQNHWYTHSLALRALGRTAEADDHLQRAHDRVMFVADRFADASMRQSWLQNVRVNRQILEDWEDRTRSL